MSTQAYVNGVTLTDSAEFNRFDTAAYSVFSSVAGTNTVTATGPANYSYAATIPTVWLIPATANTGATTINVTPSGSSALGAKNVFYNGAACVGGELRTGVPAGLIYDGTQFNIVAPGGVVAATQTQMESGVVTTHAVTPGRQQFHPSASKAWGCADFNGTLLASYNMSSVTDVGAGQQRFNFSVGFSSANYAALAVNEQSPGGTSGSTAMAIVGTGTDKATTSNLVRTVVFSTFAATDGQNTNYSAFGDQ